MGEHALLSASSSHRWLSCTPSARLEERFTEEQSVFASEGTAAHALAEHKLKVFLGQESARPSSGFDSPELEEYTDIYAAYACELISAAKARSKDPVFLIEQRLDYSCFVPEGFGTGDLVIVTDGIMDIVDFKYGKGVPVFAEDNPQMKLYALGALFLFDCLYDIKTVRMSICQPRIDNISDCSIPAPELISWAEQKLKPKAELAIKGEGEFMPGEHCRFCRARHTCRARADEFVKMAQYEFKKSALLTDDEIADILTKADMLAAWAADIWSYATETAYMHGKLWQGFKLVEGRSNRKYKDEIEVAGVLLAAGYTDKDIYRQTIIGISEMERLLGKKRFSEVLSGLVEKPKGKPALVPESDKRPAIRHKNTAIADFSN